MSENQKKPHADRPLLNILVNVVIPIFVLRKGSEPLGPLTALLIALAFPLIYGLWDYLQKKQVNYISLLGLINVLVTGTLALFGLGGIWFAIKEAAFPGLIGLFVFVSAFGKKPFASTMLLNPQLMNLDLIQERISARQLQQAFDQHMRKSTKLLSTSFFFSAVLNFIVSLYVFTPLDPSLDSTARAVELNAQIAKMTSVSLVVILIPSLFFVGGILYHLIKGIERMTELTSNEILKN